MWHDFEGIKKQVCLEFLSYSKNEIFRKFHENYDMTPLSFTIEDDPNCEKYIDENELVHCSDQNEENMPNPKEGQSDSGAVRVFLNLIVFSVSVFCLNLKY